MAIGLTEVARRTGVPIGLLKQFERGGMLKDHYRYMPDGRRSGYKASVVDGVNNLAIYEMSGRMFGETILHDSPLCPSAVTVNGEGVTWREAQDALENAVQASRHREHAPVPPPPDETWRKVSEYERSVYANDFHCPYHDETAVGVFLSFLRWFQPKNIFLIGDIADWYQLSRFDQEPHRKLSIQQDLDSATDILRRIRRISPDSDITYFEGNHESRLMRWLCKHPEVAGLRALSLSNLLRLDDYNVKLVGLMETYTHHGFCIEHGDIVRPSSGFTAKGQLGKRGISGISGHTHRLGAHYHTDMGGDYVWYENGCLADRNPCYVKSPNWQQGFSCSHNNVNTGMFCMEQILIQHGMAVFAGREFSPLGGI